VDAIAKGLAWAGALAIAAGPGCHRGASTQVVGEDRSSSAERAPDGSSAPWVTQRWSFSLRDVSLTIEDVHMGVRLDEVLERTSAELVVNAGFFDPAGEPLGLAVSDSRVLSPASKTMSGGVLRIDGGIGKLVATEDFELSAPIPNFAVQCRPRLVVGGRVNIRQDDGPRAARTALCLRDAGRTLEIVLGRPTSGVPEPTLYELAVSLASLGCSDALNLDGGPSTGAAFRGPTGVELLAPRRAVRQAIAVRRLPEPR
jgi:exopolysaccharide biosynthesis protein